jgi:hypothetical protein
MRVSGDRQENYDTTDRCNHQGSSPNPIAEASGQQPASEDRAEEERERASGAMRSLYEQTASDTETLFRNASVLDGLPLKPMPQTDPEKCPG